MNFGLSVSKICLASLKDVTQTEFVARRSMAAARMERFIASLAAAMRCGSSDNTQPREEDQEEEEEEEGKERHGVAVTGRGSPRQLEPNSPSAPQAAINSCDIGMRGFKE